MDQPSGKPARVLLSKIGLDGHDRGVKMLARFLTDAGMEVVYLGLFQTPERIARAAIDEDVDVIGLSIHSGEHKTMVPDVIACLQRVGLHHEIPLIVGGCIPWEDIPILKRQGVSEVFPAGSAVRDIITFITFIKDATATATAHEQATTALPATSQS